jgi:DNA gyrase/topoisomerase IV subunit B
VFPLKGKLLNVRDAGLGQVTKNAEIQNLVKILGLRFNEKCVFARSRLAHRRRRGTGTTRRAGCGTGT